MRIRHVVMWTLKPEFSEHEKKRNLQLMKEKLDSMRGRIPGLLSLETGMNAVASDASWDMVLITELESRDALRVYQDHPVHDAVRSFIRTIRDKRAVVDFEIE